MRNWKSTVSEIAYRLACILMGIQIILGALWFCGNLLGGQGFPETKELLEISNTFVLDEYIGIAYPGVLWLFQKIFGESYPPFLYVVQMMAVYGAAYFFLIESGIVKRKEEGRFTPLALFGAAYLTTIPMVMQFQAARLPEAFSLATFLGLLGTCFGLCRNAGGERIIPVKKVVILAVCWFWGALLKPEYMWVMAVPVGIAFVFYMWNNRKCYPVMLVTFAAVLLLNGVAAASYQEPGSRGRMEKSVSATLLRRIVWPNFERDFFFWSHLVKITFNQDELREISNEPEDVVYVFGPAMEQAFGKEVADYEYMLMVKDTLEVRTREVLGEIVRDVGSYICPYAAVPLQLQGDGVSRSGWNYNYLCENTPGVAKLYLSFGIWTFWVLLALKIVLWFSGPVKKINEKKTILFAVAAVVWLSLWYAMEAAGVWDYRNALVIIVLWASGTFCFGARSEVEDAQKQED